MSFLPGVLVIWLPECRWLRCVVVVIFFALAVAAAGAGVRLKAEVVAGLLV